MRVAWLLVVWVACKPAESVDHCMAVELKKHACYERSEPTGSATDFTRETCDSRDFRAAHLEEPTCLKYTDCAQFTSCDERFESEHSLGNPFGVVH